MAKPFRLEIITPTAHPFNAEIIHVRAPGVGGEFGVLADHAPMMAALKPGRLHVDDPDTGFDFAVTGGYFEVHENRAIVFAETCIRKEDIDLERAIAAKNRALKELEEAESAELQAQARHALARALCRIKVAEG